MLKCATSLWSADLGNLRAEMKRVEPYSERFHLDVADGHYTPTMLFFPDLVAALRPHTRVPFEVHLMTTHPLAWLEPFCAAGADGFIVYPDAADPLDTVCEAILKQGKDLGISLKLSHDLALLEPYWADLNVVCVLGTEVGIKGAEMDPSVPDRIFTLRETIDARGYKAEIEADGGIRRHTVPLIAAAGADYIVPGSLMFKEDPPAMRKWLASL